jgi:hypothetical protein
MAAHEADRFPSINDADLDALLEARDANNTNIKTADIKKHTFLVRY